MLYNHGPTLSLYFIYAVTYASHVQRLCFVPSRCPISKQHNILFQTSVDTDLIRSLDLDITLQHVSKYTVTRRGRDAFLSIAGVLRESPSSSAPRRILTSSRKKDIRTTFREPYTRGNTNMTSTNTKAYTKTTHLIPFAQTLEQATAEYQLVQEALLIVQYHMQQQGTKEGTSTQGAESDNIILPPMFNGGIPTNSNTGHWNQDDYDDWLQHLIRHGITESLTLENIMQAEQLIRLAIRTFEWARLYIQQSSPGLFATASLIQVDYLDSVYQEIAGKVHIVQGGKSFLDPFGTKSFTFQLDETKFPQLKHLKLKEKDLRKELKLLDDQYLNPKLNKLQGSKKIKELLQLQADIKDLENIITNKLWTAIIRQVGTIHQSLEILARLDTIFARAWYAHYRGGAIPFMSQEGQIQVHDFVHPVLDKELLSTVVPIQLTLPSLNRNNSALVITGANGGGKTLALKSFGIVATMSKLGIPILTSTPSDYKTLRVDFFDNILAQIGDDQDILLGVSTLTARLVEYAHIAAQVKIVQDSFNNCTTHSLILLDELGTGTDQATGGALAQAILENLLENKGVKAIVTTHSPRLKSFSILDERLCAASVQVNNDTDAFQLQYGFVGDSNCLQAAQRCVPALPSSVLKRAEAILKEETNSDDHLEALKQSTIIEKEEMSKQRSEAQVYKEKMLQSWNALEKISKAYESKFHRMDLRLQSLLKVIQDKSADSLFTVLGDTMGEIRLMKKSTEALSTSLQDRGLMAIPDNYILTRGKKVVILAKGPWEGEMASVYASNIDSSVVVELAYNWTGDKSSSSSEFATFRRKDLAMWCNFNLSHKKPYQLVEKLTRL